MSATIDAPHISTARLTELRTAFREGKARLPIKPLSTIDVPQMFAARKSIDRVLRVIERELPVEFDRAIKLALERMK